MLKLPCCRLDVDKNRDAFVQFAAEGKYKMVLESSSDKIIIDYSIVNARDSTYLLGLNLGCKNSKPFE